MVLLKMLSSCRPPRNFKKKTAPSVRAAREWSDEMEQRNQRKMRGGVGQVMNKKGKIITLDLPTGLAARED